jgi:DNA polymerase-1
LTKECKVKDLDFNKPIRTRSGDAVRILTTDRNGDHPVVALIGWLETPKCYGTDGRCTGNKRLHPDDLINVDVETVQFREIWPQRDWIGKATTDRYELPFHKPGADMLVLKLTKLGVKPQLLIDGDLILYKATSAAEFESNPEGDLWFLSTNLEKARDMWDSQLEVDHPQPGERRRCCGPLGSPRISGASWSPATRATGRASASRSATLWSASGSTSATLTALCPCPAWRPTTTSASWPRRPNAPERIIVSDDKDLKTIPGRLYRQGVLHEITMDQANLCWLSQTLTGDPADGYKGCPGVGEVKAKAILSKPGGRWENVKQAFLKAGLTESDAVLQARLARILRHGDWDSANKRPKLWSPGTTGGDE